MTLTGDVVLDLVQHFVERWNEIKTRKYESNEYVFINLSRLYPKFPFPRRYDWLSLPHNIESAPNEPVSSVYFLSSCPRLFLQHHTVGHPHREQWHEIGRKFKQRFHLSDYDEEPDEYPRHPAGSCRVQAVRSVSDWSHGVLTEHSIQNACE